jgi:hypothetical protein
MHREVMAESRGRGRPRKNVIKGREDIHVPGPRQLPTLTPADEAALKPRCPDTYSAAAPHQCEHAANHEGDHESGPYRWNASGLVGMHHEPESRRLRNLTRRLAKAVRSRWTEDRPADVTELLLDVNETLAELESSSAPNSPTIKKDAGGEG